MQQQRPRKMQTVGRNKRQNKSWGCRFPDSISFTGLNWCTEHDSCQVSLVCFHHKATTLRVLNLRHAPHTHTHTPGVSYKHTQAWLIGSCTVITAEAIRLVPAPWATQQGVARQRGLVWGRIVVCVSVCVCYCGDWGREGGERRLSFCGLHCPPPQKSKLIFTIQGFL